MNVEKVSDDIILIGVISSLIVFDLNLYITKKYFLRIGQV
jgi:hypothetical protein